MIYVGMILAVVVATMAEIGVLSNNNALAK